MCKLYENKRNVLFHPIWSNGTLAIRGNKVLNRGCPAKYYWEIQISKGVYGTSLMFGIGTNKVSLYSSSYINIIGEDNNGWSLSHKGLLWHNGLWRKYTKPFTENQSTTVGLLYDSLNGTLAYFKDGIYLGIAFTGLNKISSKLYPFISSTTAKCEMMLCKTLKSYYILSLQERCLQVIRDQWNSSEILFNLPPCLLRLYISMISADSPLNETVDTINTNNNVNFIKIFDQDDINLSSNNNFNNNNFIIIKSYSSIDFKSTFTCKNLPKYLQL